MRSFRTDSPVSNNGRGLKPVSEALERTVAADSPVSNNGRGLKLADLKDVVEALDGFAR